MIHMRGPRLQAAITVAKRMNCLSLGPEVDPNDAPLMLRSEPALKEKQLGIRILCAGKNDRLVEFVKEAVDGFDCEVVKTTSVGLAIFLAQKNFPCLILCEPELAEGSVQELYTVLKSEPDLTHIPFFVVNDKDQEPIDQGIPALCINQDLNEMRSWLTPFLIEIPDTRSEETSE